MLQFLTKNRKKKCCWNVNRKAKKIYENKGNKKSSTDCFSKRNVNFVGRFPSRIPFLFLLRTFKNQGRSNLMLGCLQNFSSYSYKHPTTFKIESRIVYQTSDHCLSVKVEDSIQITGTDETQWYKWGWERELSYFAETS